MLHNSDTESCRADMGSSLLRGRSPSTKLYGWTAEESNFGNAFRQIPFSSWRTSFKTEVCSGSGCPSEAMRWIKGVEVATSVDDLQTSQSFRRYRFPNFEMRDATIADHPKFAAGQQALMVQFLSTPDLCTPIYSIHYFKWRVRSRI